VKIVIIGSGGQLGNDLVKSLSEKHEVTGLKHTDVEITDYKSCAVLRKCNPDLVINTAAFHSTDRCEEEPLKAFHVNAVGAMNVARISNEIGATVVYISTDYVFDGTKNEPYIESDNPNPINAYGTSKLAGELCTKQNPKHYITRVASLFGFAGASGKGGNFVETMIAKSRKGEPITVVNDMWMSPTYTKDASIAIAKIIDQQLPFGTYHVTNQGFCTWFQFTEEIFSLLELEPRPTPIETSQLQFKAKRPRYSVLRSTKLASFGITMPEWKKAVEAYLTEKGHISRRA
jgi:dTDP-4-dehydrorhamnose reductase